MINETLHLRLLFHITTARWRRGSVVRMSVFGWQTFPDLCLIYGWHVTTSWVVSAMSQQTQPSIPPGSVNE